MRKLRGALSQARVYLSTEVSFLVNLSVNLPRKVLLQNQVLLPSRVESRFCKSLQVVRVGKVEMGLPSCLKRLGRQLLYRCLAASNKPDSAQIELLVRLLCILR
jgi:hypothetical protein